MIFFGSCMEFIAMQAGCWISNPLPNEQNADLQADAGLRKRGFCECGSQVGCSFGASNRTGGNIYAESAEYA